MFLFFSSSDASCYDSRNRRSPVKFHYLFRFVHFFSHPTELNRKTIHFLFFCVQINRYMVSTIYFEVPWLYRTPSNVYRDRADPFILLRFLADCSFLFRSSHKVPFNDFPIITSPQKFKKQINTRDKEKKKQQRNSHKIGTVRLLHTLCGVRNELHACLFITESLHLENDVLYGRAIKA